LASLPRPPRARSHRPQTKPRLRYECPTTSPNAMTASSLLMPHMSLCEHGYLLTCFTPPPHPTSLHVIPPHPTPPTRTHAHTHTTRPALPQPTARRIEYIGDSLTAGYGILGVSPCTFSAATEDVFNAYPYQVCPLSSAWCLFHRCNSISGWRERCLPPRLVPSWTPPTHPSLFTNLASICSTYDHPNPHTPPPTPLLPATRFGRSIFRAPRPPPPTHTHAVRQQLAYQLFVQGGETVDTRVAAWSGKGLVRNYNGSAGPCMPELWQRTLANGG
jgi:hypothetical protein